MGSKKIKLLNILSIIPARSGSKGIINKNIKLINNHPLISYTINTSINFKDITTTFVSTDCKKIAKISLKYGAEVPFLRPKYLAKDNSGQIGLITHAIKNLEKIKKIKYDIIFLLQPTSPLRIKNDLKQSIIKISKKGCDSVVSLTKYNGISPFIIYKIAKNKPNLLIKNNLHRRQLYPDLLYRNGLIYAFSRDMFMKYKNIYGNNLGYLITPQSRSVNIDSMRDLNIFKNLLRT